MPSFRRGLLTLVLGSFFLLPQGALGVSVIDSHGNKFEGENQTLTKISAEGTVLWKKNTNYNVYRLALDSQDDVLSSQPYEGIEKWSSEGHLVWARTFEGELNGWFDFIFPDRHDDVLVGGHMGAKNPNYSVRKMAKLSSKTGALRWKYEDPHDAKNDREIEASALDAEGNLYVTGNFSVHTQSGKFTGIRPFLMLTQRIDGKTGSLDWQVIELETGTNKVVPRPFALSVSQNGKEVRVKATLGHPQSNPPPPTREFVYKP